MKNVKIFILTGCPYCRKAEEAYEKLLQEHEVYREVPVSWIQEDEHPDVADSYDYYYTPAIYVDEKKFFEARPGQSGEEIRAGVEGALREARS